jgi:hypothetical protein
VFLPHYLPNYCIESLLPALIAKGNPSNPRQKRRGKEQRREWTEEVREKIISYFNIVLFAVETSGGINCTICMFRIMSASLWEFHKLMMITQHISFKSLDIQSLLLYKVCSGHR